MTFDLVCFDLDGTLVETAPEITDAVNDTLRAYGWPVVDEAQVARWIGHGTGALLVQAIARASGRTPDEVRSSPELAAIGTVYDRYYAARCGTRSRLYPGVRETLAALRAQGTKLAIVTNKETRYTDRVLRFPVLFDRDMMFADRIEGIDTPDPQLLYTAVTGDPGDCGYFPLNAVRWLTPPRDIAARGAIGHGRFEVLEALGNLV